MSNRIESKTGAYFLSQFDFAGAIAACNAAIALTQATVDNIDDHICRAYAYCFAVEKNSANYDKAIADCSIALSVLGQKYGPKNGTVLRVRALAYYLKGDYASALSDCNWVLDKPNADYSDNEDKSFVREILATGRDLL